MPPPRILKKRGETVGEGGGGENIEKHEDIDKKFKMAKVRKNE